MVKGILSRIRDGKAFCNAQEMVKGILSNTRDGKAFLPLPTTFMGKKTALLQSSPHLGCSDTSFDPKCELTVLRTPCTASGDSCTPSVRM
jgi:hypothetical protein